MRMLYHSAGESLHSTVSSLSHHLICHCFDHPLSSTSSTSQLSLQHTTFSSTSTDLESFSTRICSRSFQYRYSVTLATFYGSSEQFSYDLLILIQLVTQKIITIRDLHHTFDQNHIRILFHDKVILAVQISLCKDIGRVNRSESPLLHSIIQVFYTLCDDSKLITVSETNHHPDTSIKITLSESDSP